MPTFSSAAMRFFLRPGFWHFSADDQALGYVMKGCFVQEQVIVLKYKCGFLTDRRDIFFKDVVERIFFPSKIRLPAVRMLQKVDTAQHRRFSRTTRTEDCNNIALFYFLNLHLLILPGCRTLSLIL